MIRGCIALLFCIGHITAQTTACPKQATYTFDDVVALAEKVDRNRARALYQACGISFVMDEATERKLSAAGVPPDLITALWATKPTPPPYVTNGAKRNGAKQEARAGFRPEVRGNSAYVAPESIRVAQHKSAQSAYDVAYERLKAGSGELSQVIDAHQKLIETDIGFSRTRLERIEAYKNALTVAKHLEALAEEQVKLGALAAAGIHEVRRHRLATEVSLSKEQSNTTPENIGRELERNARAAFEWASAKLDNGEGTVFDVIRAHDKLVEAQIVLGKTHHQWADTYGKALESAKVIDAKIAQLIERGALPPADAQQVKQHRTAIELLLAQEQSAARQ